MLWLQAIWLTGLSSLWQRWMRTIRRAGWEWKTPLQRYGNVIRWRIIGISHTSVLGPSAIRRVLEDNHTNYERHPFHRMFIPVLGTGLLSTFGEEWKRRRRILQPAFLRTRIAGLRRAILDEIVPVTEGWASMDSIELDVVQETRELALRTAARTMFPRSLRADFGPFHAALRLLSDEAPRRVQPWPRWPDWVPTPHNRRLRAAISVLRDTVRDLIRTAATDDDEASSVLGSLLSCGTSAGDAPLAEEELIDEALTMLAAGHDTVASLLAWVLIELASHPEIQERLFASLSAAGAPPQPASAGAPVVTYLDQVIDETLRLHPPVPAFVRRAVAEDVLDGWRIRPGDTIALVPATTHQHPEYWPDPTRFDPDRFESAQVKARPRYAFFPFGGGPHRCIGEHFALVETALIVEQIMHRFNLFRSDTTPVRVRGVISQQPVGPISVRFVCRCPR